jgi:hypothetical protein
MANFLAGVVVGWFLLVGILGLTPRPTLDAAKKAISECEKTLPRNVTCKLYAKPKNEG